MAAGCRDLKWCPCSGAGAGELGQAGAEPAPRLGAGQRPGPGRTQARAPGRRAPKDHSSVSREPRESAGGGGCAAPGREGGRSELGRTPAGELRVTQRPSPPHSSLSARLPYSAEVLGREVLRGSSPRAWPGRGPSFPSHAGGSERSAVRLSFPIGFFSVYPAPSLQPRTCSRRRPSADGRDLIPPAAQLGGSLIAPGRRPLALLCRPRARERAVEPPPDPGQFTLFLFGPFLWLLGKNRGKRGEGPSPRVRAQQPQKGLGRGLGEASLALSSSCLVDCPLLAIA